MRKKNKTPWHIFIDRLTLESLSLSENGFILDKFQDVACKIT